MARASAPGYDLFKLIVALILAAILVLMLLRGCAVLSPPTALIPAETTASTSPEMAAPSATASPALMPTQTIAAPTVVPASPTPPAVLTIAPTQPPTTTPVTPVAPVNPQDTSCNTSAPSRLSVGQQAKVIRNLNMRDQPSIGATLIRTNVTGTILEIAGGPLCTPQGDRAYLWWNVRLDNGLEGWSAETALNESAYFLEPIP